MNLKRSYEPATKKVIARDFLWATFIGMIVYFVSGPVFHFFVATSSRIAHKSGILLGSLSSFQYTPYGLTGSKARSRKLMRKWSYCLSK